MNDIEERIKALTSDDDCWMCPCGDFIEDGMHCECGREPPWGCPCSECQGGEHPPECDCEECLQSYCPMEEVY